MEVILNFLAACVTGIPAWVVAILVRSSLTTLRTVYGILIVVASLAAFYSTFFFEYYACYVGKQDVC